MAEPFFFSAGQDIALMGIWRQPAAPIARVWVICPPFAEEEKSARRTLTEIALALQQQGHASLIFSYRGTGDSGGDFAVATLADWRHDIAAACREARRRAPEVALGLLGVRLGASLALEMGAAVAADRLVLIEPTVNGRQYLAQMGQRKRLRSMLTQEQGNVGAQGTRQHAAVGRKAGGEAHSAIEDLDGWPLSAALRGELESLDLLTVQRPSAGEVQLLQVGSRQQIAAPLERLGERIGAIPRVVVLQPFWNKLDYVHPEPLLEAMGLNRGPEPAAVPLAEPPISPFERDAPERAFAFQSVSGQQLIGVWHEPAPANDAPRPAVLMLHGWSGYRTGPHQMLTRAARRFAGAGFGVLRFDFGGRGDSEGDFGHATLATMANDAQAALGWCGKQGHASVVLVGLCSGCEVALAVATAPGVSGMALWSAPVFAALAEPARTARKRGHHLRQYGRKLLRPASYAKLLGGRLDTRSIGQVLARGGGGEAKNLEAEALGQLPPGWRQAALERYAGYRAPLLLVYGTADPLAAEALQWHLAHSNQAPPIHRIAGANHSYYGMSWEREVIESTLGWLNRQFAV